MYEDLSIKAILIGVGIFITTITISLVLSYYNVAKETATGVVKGKGSLNYTRYRSDIEEILLKDKVTGIELKNVIMYFKDEPLIQIDINNMYSILDAQKINGTNINNNNSYYLSVIDKIPLEMTFSLSKQDISNNITKLTFTGLS